MDDFVPLLKHNPSAQDPKVLEAITVQREPLIAGLVAAVLDTGGGLRHQLLVGPRGMGKTHILTLVASRVRDNPRADAVVLAWLDEDPWAIRTYDKFLAAIIARVAAETDDSDLERRAEDLRSSDGTRSLEGEEVLREALGARRLVLLVENLDEVFRRIGPDGQAKLRAFVENWRGLLILASAPQLFEGVREHASPFYGFFAITHLDELSLASAEQLLKRVAELRGDTDLLRFLETETATRRLETIEALAGGHPRIWLLFAGCISIAAIDQLVPLFLEALDELTPYYQDRLRELSDQQQELVVILAESGGALSNRALAERSGIAQNQIATMLRQLTDRGYVRAAKVDEKVAGGDQRMSYWELREPLMRLCLDVKQARGKPLRMVVEFLRAWYGSRILDELARLPVEARLAAAYAGEAFRTLEGNLSSEDLLRGSADEIVARAEQGLALTPERLDLQVARSTGLIMGRRFDEAREVLGQLIDDDSRDRRSLMLRLMLGVAEAGLGEPDAVDAAVEDLKQAGFYPEDPAFLILVGSAYDSLGRDEDALAAYEKAIELEPAHAGLLQRVGILAGRVERSEDALAAFTKLLELNPESAITYTNIGIALGRLGRDEESLTAHRKAVEIEPDNAYVQDRLGNALGRLGHLEEALALRVKATELDPDDGELQSNLGVALGAVGRKEEALAAFEQAAKVDPGNSVVQRNLGIALIDSERVEEAASLFRRLIESEPADAELFSQLGVALSRLGPENEQEALEAFEKAAELDPDRAVLQTNLGLWLRRLGRLDEALAIFERASELDPDGAEAHEGRGAILREMARKKEALGAFDKAAEVKPTDAVLHNTRANLMRELGRYDEAEAAVRTAIELDGEEAVYRFTLAEVVLDRGEIDTGLEHLREALATWRIGSEGRPGETDLLCRILWERLRGDRALDEVVAEVVKVYGQNDALEALGQGVVASIPLFTDPDVGQAEADSWVEAWSAAEGGEEFEIPLDMLDAAGGWKRDRDRVHLLNLPLEQRQILIGLLPSDPTE